MSTLECNITVNNIRSTEVEDVWRVGTWTIRSSFLSSRRCTWHSRPSVICGKGTDMMRSPGIEVGNLRYAPLLKARGSIPPTRERRCTGFMSVLTLKAAWLWRRVVLREKHVAPNWLGWPGLCGGKWPQGGNRSSGLVLTAVYQGIVPSTTTTELILSCYTGYFFALFLNTLNLNEITDLWACLDKVFYLLSLT